MLVVKTPKKPSLWEFIDSEASFRVHSPTSVSRLYFPLGNEAGLLSSITPDLHGDIKTSYNSFLTIPVSVEDLHNTKSNRNFWVYVEGKGAWSLTGVSARQEAERFNGKAEKVTLEAGTLWHKVTRESAEWKLRSEIVNFAPASDDKVELMLVTLTNTGTSKLRITPSSAIPIFARSADNLRDHHHVTSLLHRIISHPAGVVVKPTMSFDERGHKLNETSYAVLGFQDNGEMPLGSFYTVPDFIGEGGDFESPLSVLENRPLPEKDGAAYQGKSAVGALRFKTQTLAPGKKARFVLILGVAEKASEIDGWIRRFGSVSRAETALEEAKAFWKAKLDRLRFHTQNPLFNGWMRWVSLQPTLRKIFGCSFLPDFDYGRGGRGWRDLWQDCLALLLTAPQETRRLLLHNFNGVRIDGSNATIIGAQNNEFIADRNNITRVWMDHGVWPYITLELYIHQTGDTAILFENGRYFRDRQQSRARVKDNAWTEAYGKELKTKNGAPAEGSILEHLLVQHLVQFFNVGEHNHIRLENADWNDGLDMAYERGESVAFTALYSSNLRRMAELVETAAAKQGLKKVPLAKELLLLLDRVLAPKVNYYEAQAKRRRLEKYFDAVQPEVSGRKVEVAVSKLAADLRTKADFIVEHVRKKEWIQTRSGDGLYNGYYDNHGRRVEGDSANGLRMTLAGQVFPVMGGVATNEQTAEIYKSARKYLKDRLLGGYRLNTDFKEIRLDLGRAYSFAYGEKENGAFFSHMAVMFANALYRRGFVNEGHEVLDSIYRMAVRTEKSRIYPGIPEYFNSEGRGLYHYLTGSASWYVLTLLTQVFGVRGHYGDLLLEPKLTKDQYGLKGEAAVETSFADKMLSIVYRNPKKLPHEPLCVSRLTLNGQPLKEVELQKKEVLIPRELLLKHCRKTKNEIVVTLE
jgi:cellobiose phosphorylase